MTVQHVLRHNCCVDACCIFTACATWSSTTCSTFSQQQRTLFLLCVWQSIPLVPVINTILELMRWRGRVFFSKLWRTIFFIFLFFPFLTPVQLVKCTFFSLLSNFQTSGRELLTWSTHRLLKMHKIPTVKMEIIARKVTFLFIRAVNISHTMFTKPLAHLSALQMNVADKRRLPTGVPGGEHEVLSLYKPAVKPRPQCCAHHPFCLGLWGLEKSEMFSGPARLNLYNTPILRVLVL